MCRTTFNTLSDVAANSSVTGLREKNRPARRLAQKLFLRFILTTSKGRCTIQPEEASEDGVLRVLK